MSQGRRLAVIAATVVVAAALLAMGDAISGISGLAGVATAEAMAGLLAARGTLGRAATPVPAGKSRRRHRKRRPAVTTANFPGFSAIASEISWAGVSRRHYDHGLRPRLARLAAGKGLAIDDLTGPPSGDDDALGPDLATLERLISKLEDP